ncbi:diphosphate--fructose-6-phosphate 1-phosphotransferase [Paenibacillus sp. J2TS4]|uniref:diphosphate--fructose-6-phosphate 1-phosphotransferase n=1 Tax=Paenibacillus sp. J2TS4 TaxID=2807194 RepID=UPI001B0CC49E|nr:diphosphate--fructose-6-phosphate 1-phosphotransferase [Paenibacillus sp. J2TS4]GIP31558.1 6-phosphofructokinase [Paenibacillus sp. J2TS4]
MMEKPTGIRQRNRLRVAIAQVGGPTAVINCSLLGFVNELREQFQGEENRLELFGVVDGMSGLCEGRFFKLDTRHSFEWLKDQPGAALGAGRKALSQEDLLSCLESLRRHDIRALALAGGNGTMWACRSIEQAAKELGYELQVIGIPKTVDNDIRVTDHTPGFPSAAKFVAHAIRDIWADLQSMRNFEQVRVIETMGRNVGWLSAASGYFKEKEEDAPHLIYIPEKPFDFERMVKEVKDVYEELGCCLVVASEGLKDADGQPIRAQGIANGKKNGQGLQALGGIGSTIAETISKELGLACRYENLGILQRCASFAVSQQDQIEAEAVGRRAASLLLEGASGCMVTIVRLSDQPYRWDVDSAPFDEVAGIERNFDPLDLSAGGRISERHKAWLKPFIGQKAPYRRLNLSSV